VPESLLDLLATYGYAAVFVGIFLENAGLPVPGETTLLASAALARSGRMSLAAVIVVAAGAAILGDNMGFWIGRRGGRTLAERYGRRFGLTPTRLAEFDRFFARHGAKTVFIARFVTGLRVVCAILAGSSGMDWRRFLFFNATGAVAWSLAVAAAGYTMAYSWERLQGWIGQSGLIALALVALVVVIAEIRRRREQKP
jgi:membrane protein DedA with SNARE-associated domain